LVEPLKNIPLIASKMPLKSHEEPKQVSKPLLSFFLLSQGKITPYYFAPESNEEAKQYLRYLLRSFLLSEGKYEAIKG